MENVYSCTFLNTLGDLTITWDDNNKDKVLEVIKKKMEEGYTFFTTKKYLFGTVTKKSQVTTRDLKRGTLSEIIISDEEFDKMVENMKDKDIVTLIKDKKVLPAKVKGKKSFDMLSKAKNPEDVLTSQSVAVKPIYGG